MKNVVLGVTGSIACYKACDLVSKLKKNKDINVDVIMTSAAMKLVGQSTFQSLSKNPVSTDLFQEVRYWEISHISLAKKADILVIAPATANIIAKLATGIADDMLSTVALATKAKILVAPAMNTNMYENEATQKNIKILMDRGVEFVEPSYGLLACEDVGKGKLADVELIHDTITHILYKNDKLRNKKILITAGHTIEDIDPVRYITNRSTGKMGYALAKQAVLMGADVTLISGETNLDKPLFLHEFVKIRSSEEMYNEVDKRFDDIDIVIKAAAVSDFTPEKFHDNKIKKDKFDFVIPLKKTKDIIKNLGLKKKSQIIVGFAAETTDIQKYAIKKLNEKNMDMIVANDVSRKDAGFSSDTNIVTIFTKNNKYEFDKESKDIIAKRILETIKEDFEI